jgi:nitrogenase-stabilizing/protective protein
VTPLLPELLGAAEAEEIFDVLDVPYDAVILAACRLHVLRRFGLCAAAFLAEHPRATEAERREALRRALRESHDTFTRSRPREEKLFRVHGGGRPVVIGGRLS